MIYLNSAKFKTWISLVILLTLCLNFLPTQLKADVSSAVDTGAEATASNAGLPLTENIAAVVGKIIYIVLGFLGIVFVLLIIYGGFLRMTASGNPETIKTSNQIIIGAIVGFAIIMASYAITFLVITQLGGAVTNP